VNIMDRAALLSMADRVATRSGDPELYTLLHHLIDRAAPTGDFMEGVAPVAVVVAPAPDAFRLEA
jgi:hypothetical protein